MKLTPAMRRCLRAVQECSWNPVSHGDVAHEPYHIGYGTWERCHAEGLLRGVYGPSLTWAGEDDQYYLGSRLSEEGHKALEE